MRAGVNYSTVADPSISAYRMEIMISKLKTKGNEMKEERSESVNPKELNAF